MSGPTKADLETIKTGLEEKIKVLEGQLKKQSQTVTGLPPTAEVVVVLCQEE